MKILGKYLKVLSKYLFLSGVDFEVNIWLIFRVNNICV